MRFYGQESIQTSFHLSFLWWSPVLISILGVSLTSSFSLYHPAPLLPLSIFDVEKAICNLLWKETRLLYVSNVEPCSESQHTGVCGAALRILDPLASSFTWALEVDLPCFWRKVTFPISLSR